MLNFHAFKGFGCGLAYFQLKPSYSKKLIAELVTSKYVDTLWNIRLAGDYRG